MEPSRRSKKNRKWRKYEEFLGRRLDRKTCLLRYLPIEQSVLFKELYGINSLDDLKNLLELSDSEDFRDFPRAQLFFRIGMKVNGYDYVLEVYEDSIRHFINEHFKNKKGPLEKKALIVAFLNYLKHAELEEMLHLVTRESCGIEIHLEGGYYLG